MEESVSSVAGIGPSNAEKLSRAGIQTVGELIEHFPKDYRDESQLSKLGNVKLGHIVAKVRFTSVATRRSRKGRHITEAIANDETGSVRVIWFRQPYRSAQISNGGFFYMSGELGYKQGRVGVISPTIEPAEDNTVHTARIVPIYRESGGLTSRQYRKWIANALGTTSFDETLPSWLIKDFKLMAKAEALNAIHFPQSLEQLDEAKRRLGLDELLGFMLAVSQNKQILEAEKAPEIIFKADLAKQFVSKLPFKLTNAQRKVIWQIYQDIAKSKPSNRLVEGDVGSGKTVIAAMSALMALDQGYQVAMLAPTDLLARQHAEGLLRLFESVGKGNEVGLLVGSLSSGAKQRAQQAIESGKIKLAVGTHALLQDAVNIPNLGLVIVDEQHRFGVEQRKKLEQKSKLMPHSIYLTATPIPRSLALTLYGEMDISVLDEKPAGRQRIETTISSSEGLPDALRKIQEVISSGGQVFVVCPLITKKDNPNDLTAAENMKKYMQGTLKKTRVGLLHGRLKAAEKEEVMKDFLDKKFDILVSTTVIEVGVDVPNATMILIYGAERFGLAQLHQLRGRVGRSDKASSCILLTSDDQNPPDRLKAMSHMHDGFKLAEYDLELRGPGAIYGTLQHGALDLKVAKLTNTRLISEARKAAEEFALKEDISRWPGLLKRTELLRSITYLN